MMTYEKTYYHRYLLLASLCSFAVIDSKQEAQQLSAQEEELKDGTLAVKNTKLPYREQVEKTARLFAARRAKDLKGNIALVIIDVQKDFCEKSIARSSNASSKVPLKEGNLKSWLARFKQWWNSQTSVVMMTSDWHTGDHTSFAINHGIAPFTMLGSEMYWPVHCVQETEGAEPAISLENVDILVYKGKNKDKEQYSAAESNSPIYKYLEKYGIKTIDIVGIATDYCVGATAIDLCKRGYNVNVIVNQCRGVEHGTSMTALQKMYQAGATFSFLGDMLPGSITPENLDALNIPYTLRTESDTQR